MNYKIVSLSAHKEQKLVWFKIISDSIVDCEKQMLINSKLNKHSADSGKSPFPSYWAS